MHRKNRQKLYWYSHILVTCDTVSVAEVIYSHESNDKRLHPNILIHFILDISQLPHIQVSPNIVYEDVLKVTTGLKARAPVVRRPISTKPKLNLIGFIYSFIQKPFWDNFLPSF